MTDTTESKAASAAAGRLAPAGVMLLLMTSFFWGVSWPISKFVMSEWPPLSVRGVTGTTGAALVALYALARRIDLRVPADQWPRLLISAALNVTLWMVAVGVAISLMPASEVVIISYTMPVWTALLAWPLLGERMTWLRVIALVMAFAGLAVLLGGNGVDANIAKLPGVLLSLAAAVGFAIGTIFLKKNPLRLPRLSAAAWQIGAGCAPVAVVGLLIERPDFAALTQGGWAGLAYLTFFQFSVSYVAWFAALDRLPASVATIVTMLVPVIGVIASGIALHEPLGPRQIGALVLTVVGVLLAVRP